MKSIIFLLKERKLKRLQNSNIELKFESKIIFHGLNPHPVFQLAKQEHKTTPATFLLSNIEFHRDPDLPDLAKGKISSYNPYSGFKYTTCF